MYLSEKNLLYIANFHIECLFIVRKCYFSMEMEFRIFIFLHLYHYIEIFPNGKKHLLKLKIFVEDFPIIGFSCLSFCTFSSPTFYAFSVSECFCHFQIYLYFFCFFLEFLVSFSSISVSMAMLVFLAAFFMRF